MIRWLEDDEGDDDDDAMTTTPTMTIMMTMMMMVVVVRECAFRELGRGQQASMGVGTWAFRNILYHLRGVCPDIPQNWPECADCRCDRHIFLEP